MVKLHLNDRMKCLLPQLPSPDGEGQGEGSKLNLGAAHPSSQPSPLKWRRGKNKVAASRRGILNPLSKDFKIGNSQGIRIPKPLIQQAHLEGRELDIPVVNHGILVMPSKKPREGWEKAIEAIIASKSSEVTDNGWLNATLTSDDDLEWS